MEGLNLHSIINDIYKASYQPAHWQEVLRQIGELTRSDSAAMIYRDKEVGQASAVFTWNLSEQALIEFGQLGVDPHFQLFVRERPLGIAAMADDLVPDRQALETYYGADFNAYARRHDMHHFGGVILLNDDTRMLGIGLQRSAEAGPWPPGIMEPLTAISPHIQRALHIHREFTRLRSRAAALNAGLDRMVLGVILIDAMFECIYCNPVARDIIDTSGVLELRNNQLLAVRTTDNSRLQRALSSACQATGGDGVGDFCTALGLWKMDQPTQLPVLVTPARDGRHDLPLHDAAAEAVVLISDPDRNQPIVPEALMETYGLTAAEAKVAIALANGYGVEEVAGIHNTKLTTTRAHIKAIFRKLGINRQTELVKALLTGPFRVHF